MNMNSKRFRMPGNNSNGGVPAMSENNDKLMQDFNNRQIYNKGFTFGCVAGNGNGFNVPLGGTCRQLYGIIIFVPTANINDDDIISLKVNQETVIDNVNWKSYSPAASGNTFKPNEFYKLRRSLSGNDDIVLLVNAVNAHNIFPVFYVSNSAQPQ